MIVPGSANALMLGQSQGYNLTKSLRFRSSASAYLNRTPASATNRQTWTWSGWIKRGALSNGSGIAYTLFEAGAASSDFLRVAFSPASGSECIDLQMNLSSSAVLRLKTSALYRDPSAWYHVVIACGMTQSTASDRMKIYVNGVQVTSFSTNTNSTSTSTNTPINNTVAHAIGADSYVVDDLFDGYMTEINFIDGQQLTPSSFGSTNATTGVWQPAKYTGTYGTNGFYLPFTDVATTSGSNAGLGKDFSGNGNYFNTNNISVTAGSTYDSMTDVPTLTSATTANYATLNPVNPPTGACGLTYSNANLTLSSNAGAPPTESSSLSTIYFPSTGKFYAEMTVGTVLGSGSNSWPRFGVAGYGMGIGGYVNFGGSSYGTFTTGDVMMVAWDASNGKIWWGKNGTWLNSGVPASGTGNISTFTYDATSAYVQLTLFFSTTGSTGSVNFGQQGFTYTPPTGFVALNTYNLPTSTIVKGNKYMDATLYTGTLLSNAVTNTAGFKPDLVWIKSRSAATDNKLTDSVRGVTKGLISNTTGAETTDTQGLTAFGTGGFTVGTDTVYNNLAATYVGWQWQAGQGTTSSNTNGSITSTVSVNATAGFSVVTYTGTGANATVGHGLGVAPSMIIVKNRSSAVNWEVYHASLGNGYYIYLNATNAAMTAGASTVWNTAPTSSVFGIGSSGDVNGNTNNLVAYCWAEIAGFSKFGSYTGNGSADGPFIYLGFRPAYILIKRTDTANDWVIEDKSRIGYNVANYHLLANSSGAEATDIPIDFLSNGFKCRGSGGSHNASGGTYIYAAFAENPFKNALAR